MGVDGTTLGRGQPRAGRGSGEAGTDMFAAEFCLEASIFYLGGS